MKNNDKLKFCFTFIFIALVGILNFIYLAPPVVNWDEGTHGIWGFWVWLALKEGNFSHFLALMRTQFAYPPLGSLTIALTNLPFEFSLALARFTSTLGLIAGGILIYLLAKQLAWDLPFVTPVKCSNFDSARLSGGPHSRHPRSFDSSKKQLPSLFSNLFNLRLLTTKILHPRLLINKLQFLLLNSYFLILFLFLASPAILFYSVTVFKESWGAALTLLTIYLYFRAIKNKKTTSFLMVGFSLIFLFLEKYNYAVLLVMPLMMEALVEFMTIITDIKIIKLITFIKRQLAVFAPVLIFASWWILTPDNKLQWFIDIMRSDWNPVTVGVGSKVEYLLFYVNSIRASYVFSDVIFWFLATGYILAIKDLGNKKIRFLFVFFTLNMVLGTLHAINLQDRYIYTAVPALFLLSGYEISKLFFSANSWLQKQSSRQKTVSFQFINLTIYAILFTILIFLLKNIFYFPTLLKSNASHMLLSALYNESDYKDTLFNFNKYAWPVKVRGEGLRDRVKGDGQRAKGVGENAETPNMVFDYILDNIDINKPVELVGFTSEMSPDWLRLMILMKQRAEKIDGFTRAVKMSDSQFNPPSRKPSIFGLLDVKILFRFGRISAPDEVSLLGSKPLDRRSFNNLTINNYIITLEVDPKSRIYTYDYRRANLWQTGRIKDIESRYKDNLITGKEFAELGVSVKIYGFN